jgi:hypothetical protein
MQPRRRRGFFVLAVLALLGLAWSIGFGRRQSLVGEHERLIDPATIGRRFAPPIPFDKIESEYSVTLSDRANTAEVLYVGGVDGWLPPVGKVRIICLDASGRILQDVIGRP